LRWFHVVGVICGLIGVVIIVGKGGGLNFELQYINGYIYALIAALIWALYSIFSRHFGDISTASVGGFCLITAVLSLMCHLVFETTILPSTTELLAIIALGLACFL
jgi:drug/metabolite transporter (DMT)-like permease